MRFLFRTTFVLAVVFASAPALARDLYRTKITIFEGDPVNEDSVLQTTNSLKDIEELFDNDSLSDLFGPGYIADMTPVNAIIDLRGVDASLEYEDMMDVLILTIDSAGIVVRFDGMGREESQELFEDWLKGQKVPGVQTAVTSLLQAVVAESPVEPVAGNPHSLESRMFDSDFELGTLGPFLKDFPESSQRIPTLFKLDGEFGHFSAGPYSGQTYDLEFGFGWNILRRLALVTDLDLMYSRIEGEANTANATLGLGLQGRILDWWNLGLVARFGVVGSIDLGAGAGMISVSAVNHMRFDFDAFRFDLKNMVGVANTLDGIEYKDIELDYDLTNVVLKNGIEVSRPIPIGGWSRELRGRAFVTGSHYFGDELWLENNAEIGLGLGLGSRTGVRTYDPVSFDVAYVVGPDYDAVTLRLSLRY